MQYPFLSLDECLVKPLRPSLAIHVSTWHHTSVELGSPSSCHKFQELRSLPTNMPEHISVPPHEDN